MTFVACESDCDACPFPADPASGEPWAACIPWPGRGEITLPTGEPTRIVSWLDMERVPLDQVATGLQALVTLAARGSRVSPLLPVQQLVMLTEQDPGWTGVTHGLQLLGLSNYADHRDGPWERFDAYDASCGRRIDRFTGKGFAFLSVRKAPRAAPGPDEENAPDPAPDEADPWIDELDWPDRRQLIVRATGACNLACPHCFVPRFGEPGAAQLDEALDRIMAGDDGRPVDLALSGGEPRIARCLEQIAERLDRVDVPSRLAVSIQTNATRVAGNEALLGRLGSGAQAAALVNLPSFDPDIYEAMTGGGLLDDALTGIDALRKLGWTVTVNRVLTQRNLAENAPYLEEVARRWGSGVRVTLSTLSPDTPPAVLADQGPSYTVAGAAIGEAVTLARELGVVTVFAGGDCAPPACCLPSGLVHEATWFQQARQPVVTAAPDPQYERGQRYLAPSCSDCRFAARCPGISASYARQFGLEDLRPVCG